MSAPETKLRLTVGGAVNPRTSVYIVRPSDDELLELLERGEYCNVLCSRQMGKTSLLKRTRARLVERGYATAEIEVAGLLGSPKDADEWYQGLLDEIARQLRLPVNVPDWWRATSAVTANQKLIRFFREEVIAKIPGDKPVIIFLDEIDSTLKLPYTDDFFVAIRAMYNDRASDPVNERIAFCLVGVATPNELIKERRTTPYNIGRTIELRDFDPNRDDLSPIYRSLCEDETKGEATAREVVRQTGGHPYLSLRVCDELAARPCASPADVAAVVGQTFGSLDSLRSDVHFDQMLRFINERVDDKLSTLDLYRRVIGDKPVPDQTTPAHINLKLIGLAKRDGRGNLAPRNPVYRRLFNDAWARSAMPPVERRVRTARRLAVAAAILLLLTLILWIEWLYPQSKISAMTQTDDYSFVLSSYRELGRVPLYSGKADELLARFYERRALHQEQLGSRDKALLWRLNALALQPNNYRAHTVGGLINPDYPRLLMTFHAMISSRGRGGRNNIDGPEQSYLDIVIISPDWKKILSVTQEGIAQLWDLKTGQPKGGPLPLAKLSKIRAVAFSPDGKLVLTGSEDNTARLWNSESGQPVGEPMAHNSWVDSVAFSPNGQRIVTGSYDYTARIWSVESRQPIGKPMQNSGYVTAVAFSPDGKTIVTGTSRGNARQWNAESGYPIGRLMQLSPSKMGETTFPPMLIAFSPDGRVIFTGGAGHDNAQLWSAGSGDPIGEPMRHFDLVRSVSFSRDGQRILTASYDGIVRLWSATSGRAISDAICNFYGFTAFALSPDEQLVLTASGDNTARLWNTETGRPIGEPMRHQDSIRTLAFNNDGQQVLTASSDGSIRFWSVEARQSNETMTDNDVRFGNNQVRPSIGEPRKHRSENLLFAFSPNGQMVLIANGDRIVQIWGAETGQPIGNPIEHNLRVVGAAFSPDGRKVWTICEDHTARLWNADDGKPIGEPMRHDDQFRALAFSPDSRKVLTGSNNLARLWSAETGELIGNAMRHESLVRAVAFSPDGRKVLTGSEDQTARLWIAETGEPIGKPMRHESPVTAVAFSPDGKKVLTGSYDGTARLWNAEDYNPIGEPMRHADRLNDMTFSPDGQKVLTGSDDGTARLWDAISGKPIGQPMGHAGRVVNVAFSPDGKRAFASSLFWVRVAQVNDNTWHAITSWLLPGIFLGPRKLHFCDNGGSRIQLGVTGESNSIRIIQLSLDHSDAAPIAGDPAQLLADWQRRLGLKINDAGEIVPLWQ